MMTDKSEAIINTLKDFDVNAEVAHVVVGPTTIQYQLKLATKTRLSKVTSLADELTMNLMVKSVRIEAPIPGLPYVGIEIPNEDRQFIELKDSIATKEFEDANNEYALPIILGVNAASKTEVKPLEEMPHMLVAGTTGSGKSVFINNCIISLFRTHTPDEIKFILIDPKMVEFSLYKELPHLARPVATNTDEAIRALMYAVDEMERRSELLSNASVRSIKEYNKTVEEANRLPYIVVIVDELADLMCVAKKNVEKLIVRLAQKARAVGIHLILATQRPSVNVVTGLIKANIPCRVAFSLPSLIDSKTIIGTSGAETLTGKGDMLFLSPTDKKPIRLQSPFASDKDTNNFVILAKLQNN